MARRCWREGGNAIEAMIAAAATIAVVYPHMNGIGGDAFFLIAEPGRPPLRHRRLRRGRLARHHRALREGGLPRDSRARGRRGADRRRGGLGLGAGGRGRRRARRAPAAPRSSGRRHPPGARGHRRHPLARRHARRAPRRAGAGAAVSPRTIFVDGKPPEAGATFRQERSPTRSTSSPTPASTISTAAISPPRSPPTSRRRRRRSPAPISPATRRACASRLSLPLGDVTLFNTPPPTQGLASLLILGAFRPPQRRARGGVRSRPRPGRGDPARLRRPRHGGHRSGLRRRREAISRCRRGSTPRRCGIDRRRAGDRRQPVAAGRYDLDGRDRPRTASPSRSSSRSSRSSAPASSCRAPASSGRIAVRAFRSTRRRGTPSRPAASRSTR